MAFQRMCPLTLAAGAPKGQLEQQGARAWLAGPWAAAGAGPGHEGLKLLAAGLGMAQTPGAALARVAVQAGQSCHHPRHCQDTWQGSLCQGRGAVTPRARLGALRGPSQPGAVCCRLQHSSGAELTFTSEVWGTGRCTSQSAKGGGGSTAMSQGAGGTPICQESTNSPGVGRQGQRRH